MAEKLLFAVDFSPYTERLIDCASELAKLGLKDIILLNVVPSKETALAGERPIPAVEAEMEEARTKMDALAGIMEEAGLKPDKLVKAGDPTQVILDVAKQKDVDFILMGAHGRGFLKRVTLGSISESVLKLADRPVMIQKCRVIKGRGKSKGTYTCENVCKSLFSNILVANDFAKYTDRANPLLIDLARTLCTPITLLHVEEGKEDGGWQLADKAKKADVKTKMEAVQERSYQLGEVCKSLKIDIVSGSAPSAILAYADEIDATLIVLGGFGFRGVTSDLMGDVTEKVLRKSERPVLILKG
jgi:nucleotide-binding universal stress UspA family protein